MPGLPAAVSQVSQLASGDVPQHVWDAAVVGAGPAGSMAALRLRDRGRSVLLLDRRDFPRDKACGDGLIPDSLRVLRRVGLDGAVRAAGKASTRSLVFSPSRIEVEVPGDFVALRRRDFDAILAAEAARRGAVFAHGRVTAIEPGGDGRDDAATLEVAGNGSPVRARTVVLATGADVSLLDGQDMVRRSSPSAFAVRCYVRSELEIDELILSFDREILPGYGWIFPLPERTYNVGCGVFEGSRRSSRIDLRATLDRFLSTFPLGRDLLRSGEIVSPVKGARLRCGLNGTHLVRSNLLAVGETVGTTFPFTGEGIGKAMETGELAADVIDEALSCADMRRLLDYPRRVEAGLRAKYRGYQVAERWLARAWVSDLVARRIRRSDYLRGAVAGIVAETVDPKAVFSPRGLVRSLWR